MSSLGGLLRRLKRDECDSIWLQTHYYAANLLDGAYRTVHVTFSPIDRPPTRACVGFGQAASLIITWLILPVVICLFQRLSHACLSIRSRTAKLRMAHYNSYCLLGVRSLHMDTDGNSRANTCVETRLRKGCAY